jgi:hypothetical protein
MRFIEGISSSSKKTKSVRRLFGATNVYWNFLVPQFVEPFFCNQDRFFQPV